MPILLRGCLNCLYEYLYNLSSLGRGGGGEGKVTDFRNPGFLSCQIVFLTFFKKVSGTPTFGKVLSTFKNILPRSPSPEIPIPLTTKPALLVTIPLLVINDPPVDGLQSIPSLTEEGKTFRRFQIRLLVGTEFDVSASHQYCRNHLTCQVNDNGKSIKNRLISIIGGLIIL